MLTALAFTSASAATYDTQTTWGSDGFMAVRMWIPDSTGPLHGVVVLNTGINGDNRAAAADPRWQAAAGLWRCALVGTDITGGNYSYCPQGSGQALFTNLAQLATLSAHPEVANAPIAMYGFSQGAAFTYSFSWFAPQRMIAFVCAKSGYPYDAPAVALQVPGILYYGQSDDPSVYPALSHLFNVHRPEGAQWCMAEDWGQGHAFGNTEALAIPFFDHAINARVPAGAVALTGPVPLITLGNADAWIGDVTSLDSPLGSVTAAQPQGDPQTATTGWLQDSMVAGAWRAQSGHGRGATLAQPAADAQFSSTPVAVPLALDASALSTGVSQVDWYDGGALIGSTTAAGPDGVWQATWSNPPTGVHALSAMVTTSDGVRSSTPLHTVFVTATRTGSTAASFATYGSSGNGSQATGGTGGSATGGSSQPASGQASGIMVPAAGASSGGRGCGLGSSSAIGLIAVFGLLRSRIQRLRREDDTHSPG